jgi:hypothetical protein
MTAAGSFVLFTLKRKRSWLSPTTVMWKRPWKDELALVKSSFSSLHPDRSSIAA